METKSIPRGIRNNNPLNLRISDNAWLGKCRPNTDGQFEQFITMVYGIRAAFRNMRTIIRRNPNCTLKRLIEVWAPASENNTNAYVMAVCARTRLRENFILDFRDRTHMVYILAAMAFVENGQPLNLQQIEEAYDMAKA